MMSFESYLANENVQCVILSMRCKLKIKQNAIVSSLGLPRKTFLNGFES